MAVLSAEDRAFWEEHGYVVVRGAVPPESCKAAEQAVWEFLEMDPDDPEELVLMRMATGVMRSAYDHYLHHDQQSEDDEEPIESPDTSLTCSGA